MDVLWLLVKFAANIATMLVALGLLLGILEIRRTEKWSRR